VLYSEDRQANKGTADEIIKRLEAEKNYIPSSELTRREYLYLLQQEYQNYVENRSGKKEQ
jgi:hypothetical protein